MHILSCSLLVWLGSGFFFTIQVGDTQPLIDFEMEPTSSRSFISSSTNDLYLRCKVYGLDATGRPVVGRSISSNLALLKWGYASDLFVCLLYLGTGKDFLADLYRWLPIVPSLPLLLWWVGLAVGLCRYALTKSGTSSAEISWGSSGKPQWDNSSHALLAKIKLNSLRALGLQADC